MTPRFAQRWVVLRVRVRMSGIWLEYEDAGGRSRRVPSDRRGTVPGWTSHTVSFWAASSEAPRYESLELHLPSDLFTLLEASLEDSPWQAGPLGSGPATLPVFVASPLALRAYPWEWVVERCFSDAGFHDHRLEFVRLARTQWGRRTPFDLPLRVAALGSLAAESLARFLASGWLDDDIVQRFGIQTALVDPEDLDSVATAPTCDLLICDHGALGGMLGRTRALPLSLRPRVVAVLDLGFDATSPLLLATLQVPSGVSLLLLPHAPSDDVSRAVDDMLHAIIHDYPLHEVAKAIRDRFARLEGSAVRLLSDPVGVHDLRMSVALAGVVDDASGLESRVYPGDVASFLERFEAVSPSLEASLTHAAELAGLIREAFDIASSLDADFGRETLGLVPMAHAKARLAQAHAHEEEILDTLRRLGADADLRSLFDQQQEKHVDIALRRLDADLSQGVYVRPWDALSKATLCLAECLHPDKTEAYCVYGFWGRRHQVEQLLHTPHQEVDAITRLEPVRPGGVKVAVGLVGGLAAGLRSELASAIGNEWVEEIAPPADLLDELWTDDRRPAVLLLVGHYETEDIAGEPAGPRLTLPGGTWLQADEVVDRTEREDRRWAEPLSARRPSSSKGSRAVSART